MIHLPRRYHTMNFEGLGFSLPAYGHYFRDDGFVESVEEYHKKIDEEFGINKKNFKRRKIKEPSNIYTDYKVIGESRSIRVPDGRLWIIYAVDVKNKERNLSVKAHEETHVIHCIGALNALERKIKKIIPQFSFRGINKNNPDPDLAEYIAGIGSCYALTRNGFSLGSTRKRESYAAVVKAYEDFEKLIRGEKVRLGDLKWIHKNNSSNSTFARK